MKPIIIIPATWQKFSYKKYHKSWPTKGLHILILPKIYLVKNIIRFHERYWEWINVALGLWKIGLGNIMNDLWKFTSYIIWTLPKLMETLDRSVYRFNSQPNKFIDLIKDEQSPYVPHSEHQVSSQAINRHHARLRLRSLEKKLRTLWRYPAVFHCQ